MMEIKVVTELIITFETIRFNSLRSLSPEREKDISIPGRPTFRSASIPQTGFYLFIRMQRERGKRVLIG